MTQLPLARGILMSRFFDKLYRALTLDVKRYAARVESAATEARPRDEVDDLVAGWRAERPDLDLEPLQVLSRVSRLARHLDPAKRTAFAAPSLEALEVDVLSALRPPGPAYQL